MKLGGDKELSISDDVVGLGVQLTRSSGIKELVEAPVLITVRKSLAHLRL